jgi:hypothetical protein
VAVDVDNDGDLDVAAGALLAGGADVDESTLQALVWLERTDPMSQSTRSTWVIGGALDDFDGEGDIDIVGRRTQFSKVKNAERTTSSLGEATRIRNS